jgi:1-acyl-sn-glycerol-3-phosphate acyltransferase
MIFGEPLDFSKYHGQADDRLIQRQVTDEIMFELMRLSGQEYVDEYAAVVKLRLTGKPADPGAAPGPGASPGTGAGSAEHTPQLEKQEAAEDCDAPPLTRDASVSRGPWDR